ncbi:MAG: DinB family protein [Candidatus Rokuibacteriota bacterium]|nr:MAG: DinB family protein [Candidatus Rokubacteria bacterium]
MAEVPLTPVEIARLLPATVATLRAELVALPDRVLAWHPAPGEWCVKEVLGHLIEAERRGFAGRIQVILGADTPVLERWEPPEVARARGDCGKAATALLDELAAMRERSASLVGRLIAADLDRAGQHPTVGLLRVRDLLQEWVHHDRTHVRQALANVQAYVWPAMGNAQRFSSE